MSNISFGYGIHRTPTIGNDGELSECVNLIPVNGELMNIQPPTDIGVKVGLNDTLVAIHEVSSDTNKHYIVLFQDCLYSIIDGERNYICDVTGFKKLDMIGNTIILITDSGLNYILWKNGEYKVIGSKPPFLNMSFGLAPHYSDADTVTLEVDVRDYVDNMYVESHGAKRSGGWSYYDMLSWGDAGESGTKVDAQTRNEAVTDKITTALSGIVDETRKYQEDKDRFTDTFFVRYAYRTYTGHMMVSPPVMMVPTNGDAFIKIAPDDLLDGNDKSNGYFYHFYAYSSSYGFNMFYIIDNVDSIKEELEDWSDIISGVDIFVSRQVTRYNQSGKFKAVAHYGYRPSGDLKKNVLEIPESYEYNLEVGNTISSLDYTTDGDNGIYDSKKCGNYFGDFGLDTYWMALGFRKNDEEYFNELEDASTFYRLKFIETKNLTGKCMIEPDKGTLASLESRETLDDNLYSNDTIVPELSFMYNRRLNIGDITRHYHAFSCPSLFQYTNAKFKHKTTVGHTNEYEKDESASLYDYELYLNILENGTEVVVNNVSGMDVYQNPYYIYYPSTHVSSGVLVRTEIGSGIKQYAELSFDKHSMLMGCYWFSKFDEIEFNDLYEGYSLPSGTDYVIDHNMIYVSDVNNPFSFSTSNMAAVGQERILGLSTASKALSGGTEFGSNPLLCFCTDGIWPISVGSDGTYTSVKPLTRDVCNNPLQILQLDDAVAFTTTRGLMVTDGSESGTSCISMALDGKNYDEKELKGIMSDYDSLLVADTESFVNTASTCSMLYDYGHRLIHVYPTSGNKHYVYSIDSSEWSCTISERPKAIVAGYPESTFQISDGSLYQYNKFIDDDTMRKGVLITRPIAFDNPFAMKVVQDLRMSYSRNNENTKCYIQPFVSNDRYNWFKMTSLYSRSFKWFRFAIFTNLCDIDGLEGLTVQEEVVRNNKIR